MNTSRTLRLVVFALTLLAVMAGFACRDNATEPPIDTSKINLVAIDASVNEVFIGLKQTILSEGDILLVQRNGNCIGAFTNLPGDTILTDTALAENTSYNYQATIQRGGVVIVKSNEVSAQTLTPTSHNFAWQTFVLGGGDDSGLRDVTIVDDTTVYAVGEVSVRGSTGAVLNPPFNVVEWNGIQIELMTTSDIGYGYGELFSVHSFGRNDIWAGSNIPEYWDGQQWTFYGSTRGYEDGFRIWKIWGTSSHDLFTIGDSGNIRFFDGSAWQKLESSTTSPINDIWGAINPMSDKEEVYCTVSDIFQFKDRKILKLVDGIIDSVAWDAQTDVVLSVWTNRGFPLYVGGGLGLYENKTGTWQKINFLTPVYPSSVRGTALNNIFVVGSFGLVAHYNGVDWKNFTSDYSVAYNAVAVKGNIVAAVGSKNGRAILTIGKRN